MHCYYSFYFTMYNFVLKYDLSLFLPFFSLFLSFCSILFPILIGVFISTNANYSKLTILLVLFKHLIY